MHHIFFIMSLNIICKLAASPDNEINNTIALLNKGRNKIILKKEFKNITLVIGNTGAGKTTFLQWIAGDNDELTSQEQGENMGQFIIVDESRISNSTINSKTIFPELVVDNNTNEAYYDCPGFSDTRSLSYNIAGSFFSKRLTDYYEGFKIILIANHHSVRKGVDRHDFINLMRHTTQFIKNINRFRNSIAMVVTKVENTYIETTKENYVLVPDEEVIKNIANFLQNVKEHLKEKVEKLDIKEKFYESTIKLLNVLLWKENGTYTRLGVFRRPNKKGRLSEVTVLKEGKEHIQHIVRERLKYSLKGENDFGFAISEKSKNDIDQLVEVILYELRNDIGNVTGIIHGYCESVIDHIYKELDYFINGKPLKNKLANLNKCEEMNVTEEHVEENFPHLRIHLAKLHKMRKGLTELLFKLKKSNDIEDLSDNLNQTAISLKICEYPCIQGKKNISVHLMTPKDVEYHNKHNETQIEQYTIPFGECEASCQRRVKNIGVQGSYYNFFRDVYKSKIETKMWDSFFSPISYCINAEKKLRTHISDKQKAVNKTVLNLKEKDYNEMKLDEYFRKKLAQCEIKDIPDVASEFATTTQNLLAYRKYIVLTNILVEGTMPKTWPPNWAVQYNKTLKYLKDSEIWYRFLMKLLLDESSKYEEQILRDKYNANTDDWDREKRRQGIHVVDQNNFKEFLERHFIKTIEPTKERLGELNHVLNLTSKHKTNIQCLKSGNLIVKGSYIKMSDFTYDDGKVKCNTSITTVDVFSLNAFIIDRDFNGVGQKLQLSIVAPRWHIDGNRNINLNGSQPSSLPKARNGTFPGGRGNDGEAGLPGGSAGNFLGIANEISNFQFLTITANGGNGGSGQDGGNGGRGRKGEDARADDENFEKKFLRENPIVTIAYNKNSRYWLYYGKPGTRGGSGGDGGVGGYGGMEGKIRTIILHPFSNSPITPGSEGSKGRSGKGGKGGEDGVKGNDLLSVYCTKLILFVPIQLEWCEKQIIPANDPPSWGPDGRDGVSGKREEREKPTPDRNIIDVLNDYKDYLQENMKDRFKSHSFYEFFKQLSSSMKLKNTELKRDP